MFSDVRVGDELPELLVEVTPTLIIAGAIASRDYQDVHHDVELARRRGMPGIFMNILTSNGLVGRFVTDWAGPDAVVRRIAIRLGTPNFAGDTMRLTGRVTAATPADGEGLVEVEVAGRNRLGEHVTGTVTVALPLSPPPLAGGGGAPPGSLRNRRFRGVGGPEGDQPGRGVLVPRPPPRPSPAEEGRE